jgi:hypothetical protein
MAAIGTIRLPKPTLVMKFESKLVGIKSDAKNNNWVRRWNSEIMETSGAAYCDLKGHKGHC